METLQRRLSRSWGAQPTPPGSTPTRATPKDAASREAKQKSDSGGSEPAEAVRGRTARLWPEPVTFGSFLFSKPSSSGAGGKRGGQETHSPLKTPTPAPVSLFQTPMSYNFLLMETSTGFSAQDAKLHFTRSLCPAGFGLQLPAPGCPSPRGTGVQRPATETPRGAYHSCPARRTCLPRPPPPRLPCAPAAPRYRSAGASRWRPEAACGRAAAEQPVASAAVHELAMQS